MGMQSPQSRFLKQMLLNQTEEEAMFIDQLATGQDANENQEYWIGLYKNVKGNVTKL